jgi:putative transposase
MGRPYSNDLRERVVRAVMKGGLSRHQAAAQFGVGISTAILWVQRFRRTGSVEPDKIGGYRPKRIAGRRREWLVKRCGRTAFTIRALECLIPGFDGASLSSESKDALWARFFMGAPRRQRRSVERYSIVKRA